MISLQSQGQADLGDQQLEYRWIAPAVAGRPVLILLHEGLGCVAVWKDFPEQVAQATGCGVFVYSRAGYGRSTPIDLPRSLRYLHDEGHDVLPRLLAWAGFDRVMLVGHSDGASIALLLAGSGRADQVAGVVAMAPHVVNEEISRAGIRVVRRLYEHGDLRERLARLHGDNVDIAFYGWCDAWLDPGFRDWDITDCLPGIRAPVMVIQGREDEYGTALQYELIADGCGAPVETLVLDDCRHSPYREQGPATLAAISRFVDSLGGA